MKENEIERERHLQQTIDHGGQTPTATENGEEDGSNAHVAQQFNESAFYTLTEGTEATDEEPSEEHARDGCPSTAVTSFVFDRLADRLPLAFFCFSFSIFVLAVPLPVIGGSGLGALNKAPLVFFLFVGYYIGRPVLAAYRHLHLDYEQFEELPSMTVSLPAYNESNTIRETIEGIFAQKYPGPLEVVVCDDGSTDDTWEILTELRETYDNITIVQQENAGSAAARNTALAHGSHEIVLSMDTDTVLKGNALYEAGASFKRHPDAVAVGTNLGVLNPNESIWTKMQVYNYLLSMEIARMFQSQLGFVLVLSGGCCVYKREVLETVGGWNTSQLLADDTDITVRVHKHGPVTYNPNIQSYTEVPATFRSLWKQRMRWRQHGVTALLHHYRKQLNPSYGLFGLIGLPFRAIIYGIIFWQIGWFVVTFITSRSSIMEASLLLIASIIIISIALSALSVGTVTLFARNRRALDHPSFAICYLCFYRFLHFSVRFLGSLLGLYSFYLYWRYRREREISLPV